jgi:hypothetical protein
MAYTDGESLEQTQARLGVAKGDVLEDPRHEPVPPSPKRRKRRLVVFATIAGVLVVGGAVFGGVSAYKSGLADGTIVDEWTSYPGSPLADPRVILAAPSKEETIATLDAFTEEFKTTLDTEYGEGAFDWTQNWDGNDSLEPNGYGGDSMLWSYFAPEWVGATTLNDPDARRRIIELFQQLSTKYGGDDFYIANDIYIGESTESKKQFGSAYRDKQADWRAHNSIGDHSVVMTIEVVDTTLPIDKSFTSDYWYTDYESGDHLPGNFYVSLQLWGDDLLAEADQREFIERSRTFDEDNKPDPRW